MVCQTLGFAQVGAVCLVRLHKPRGTCNMPSMALDYICSIST